MRETPLQTGYIGLGSNMGDRESCIRQALDMLDRTQGVRVDAVSPVFQTEPQGLREQPWFSNCVARIQTNLAPEALLSVLADMERKLGRRRREKWGPRTIDLDILLLDDLMWNSKTLQIPHPRMCERAFVLVPLMSLAPDLVIRGRTPAEWLSQLDYSIHGDIIRQEQPNSPRSPYV
jgi:2-amino-4-hydroxy-6-hydroxymethyldihydropteridine diphosphokinase